MKNRSMARGAQPKWFFKCALNWHKPNPDFPEQRLDLPNGKSYIGRACEACGCFYFSPAGEHSNILMPDSVRLLK